MSLHVHQTLRHRLEFRTLQVRRVERISPNMQRIVLGGDELRGFVSAAPDDHVKLFFPNIAGEIVRPEMGPNGPQYLPGRDYSPMRDYTPRHYDASRLELTIDFVLHGEGPASLWATHAVPGQTLGVGGPRGSLVIASDFDHYVLVGDETALPAIGRWLAEMRSPASVDVLVEIADAEDRQSLPSDARVNITWLERQGESAQSSHRLEQALRQLPVPAGDTFYWIATESRRARAMRLWLSEERDVPKDWLKAKGYWKVGKELDDDES